MERGEVSWRKSGMPGARQCHDSELNKRSLKTEETKVGKRKEVIKLDKYVNRHILSLR